MYLTQLIQKLLFKFKYRNNISNYFHAVGYKDILIGKGSTIKDFSSFQAHRGDVQGKIVIGANCTIGESSKILAGSGIVSIGNNTLFGSKLTILGGGNVTIGNNVLISHNVVISSSSHDFTNIKVLATDTPSTFGEISISDNVFIGANSTILMGCIINEGAIVGAGSVVTQNTIIGKNEVWYGNPAKLQNTRLSIKEQIEIQMVKYLENHPFHNLFILYQKEAMYASKYGGTCSTRSIHFRSILNKLFPNNSLNINLHIAKIADRKTHTILRMLIDDKVYFSDIGMGYPITKLIPCDENIKFSCYGMDFRTMINQDKITVYIDENEGNGEIELMCIDMKLQSQDDVQINIDNRANDMSDLSLFNKLRYLFIHDGVFYKIKR